MEHSSTEFDEKLDKIDHYVKYPEMRPWVGTDYNNQKVKVLTIGESHYLAKGSTYHIDADDWYDGISMSDKPDKAGIHTRNVIFNGIKTNWKKKSKVIFKNTEDALFLSNLFPVKPESAYYNIAFMNFFQRPAEKTGKSIKVKSVDLAISKQVFSEVVNIINPTTVLFTSVLAYKNAKKNGVLRYLTSNNIPFVKCPHPATSWWNRESKAYGNKTGKNHFISFINEQVSV